MALRTCVLDLYFVCLLACMQAEFKAQVRQWMAQEGYVAGDRRTRREDLARSPVLE